MARRNPDISRGGHGSVSMVLIVAIVSIAFAVDMAHVEGLIAPISRSVHIASDILPSRVISNRCIVYKKQRFPVQYTN